LLALEIILENRFVVLAAVEHANDGYLICVHVEGDHGALFVVGDARPGRTSSRMVARWGIVRKLSQ
jgi:hypothetical protein